MNHDPNDDIKNGELDESRLTAYALEQLEGAERAAVEALLAESDRSRHTVEEISAAWPPRSRRPPFKIHLLHDLPSCARYWNSTYRTRRPRKWTPNRNRRRQKPPRRGRRRSTLIWAAAACALVAAIPAYVLISGSMGPDLRPVALDARVAETLPRSIVTDDELILGRPSREGAEVLVVGEPLGDVTGLEAAGAPVEGKSNSARRHVRGQVAAESAGPMKGRKGGPSIWTPHGRIEFGRRARQAGTKEGSRAVPSRCRYGECNHRYGGPGRFFGRPRHPIFKETIWDSGASSWRHG